MSNTKLIVIDDYSSSLEEIVKYLSYKQFPFEIHRSIDSYSRLKDTSCHILFMDAKLASSMLSDHDSWLYASIHCDQSQRALFHCTFLYVFGEQNDIVEAMLKGADDGFLTPVSTTHVYAKLLAQERRLSAMTQTFRKELSPIKSRHLTIDPYTKQLYIKDKSADLTSSEFNILFTLAQNTQTVFQKEDLFNMITGQKSLGDYNALMTHISRLRKKIASVDAHNQYILTVRNQGYKFNESLL